MNISHAEGRFGNWMVEWLTLRLQSQQYHLNNPYWKTFDPYVLPLLDKPMDLRRYEELDTSKDVEFE